MRVPCVLVAVLALAPAWATAQPATAQPATAPAGATRPLIDLADPAAAGRITPSSAQVTFKPNPQHALEVAVAPGKDGYPGINIAGPGNGTWDLSAFGHVAARVANAGDKPLPVSLRLDGAEDPAKNPWNAEFVTVPPGESREVVVRFGYSYGKRGYKLDAGKVKRVLIFTNKSANPQAFRVESVAAGGTPGERPPKPAAPVMTVPKDGVFVGAGVAVDRAKQLEARGGAATPSGDALRLTFPEAAKDDAVVRLKPPAGRWDLRAYTRVTVRLRNVGTTPATPRARLESQPGNNDWVAAGPVAPNAAADLVLPFAGGKVWDGSPKSGPQFASDAGTAVAIGSAATPGGSAFVVESIRADRPAATVPEWLGKRPPVEGKWKQTFDDNFDGTAIDPARWSVVGENYYDKVTHFSPANATVKDGFARLRFERKPGTPNDDPKRTPRTDFATGFLTGFNKWTQTYGYFEARMKLPTAKGLWPAFWMMPDRGAGSPSRGTTSKGGMEFDIMEHMTRYGPNRYNIAMHWDDYGKDHKSTGTENVYVAPDADGFITAGVLWEPGRLTYYCNGVVVAKWENVRVASVPMHMMFTLPSGGWGGNDLDEDDAGLPDDFVVDYVRAWQREDLAGTPGR